MSSLPPAPISPIARWVDRLAFPFVMSLFCLISAFLLVQLDPEIIRPLTGPISLLLVLGVVVPALWLIGYRSRGWPRHGRRYVAEMVLAIVASLIWEQLAPLFVLVVAVDVVCEMMIDWMTGDTTAEPTVWSCTVCDQVNEPGLPVCTRCSAPSSAD